MPMRSLFIIQGLVAFVGCLLISRSLAEDPVVVRYADPSLTRLEKEIGVTPAQKDRFDDIVVKYRDQSYLSGDSDSSGTEAESSASPQSGGRKGGGGHRRAGGSAFTAAKGTNLRQELEELATVLTQEQLKKFEDLAHHRDKHPHPSP
jgi:hypothetical protein